MFVCATRPVCRPGARSGPGRPAAWRPASSSAGLAPTGGPQAQSSELQEKQHDKVKVQRFSYLFSQRKKPKQERCKSTKNTIWQRMAEVSVKCKWNLVKGFEAQQQWPQQYDWWLQDKYSCYFWEAFFVLHCNRKETTRNKGKTSYYHFFSIFRSFWVLIYSILFYT